MSKMLCGDGPHNHDLRELRADRRQSACNHEPSGRPPDVVKDLAPGAIGSPRGRAIGLPYLRGFVEQMKATGFVADALARSNQPDATVAPPVARRREC